MKTIFLNGDVGWEITADKILTQIDLKSKEKLQVLVNSYGGDVFEAYLIYNIFKSYAGQVEFVIMGIAMSAMSYIIMSGDKISAFKNSVFMAHRPWCGICGDAGELRSGADVMEKLENVIIEAYQTRMSGTCEELLGKMQGEIWAIGWEELTDMGIIDNVVDKVDEIIIEETVQNDFIAEYENTTIENSAGLLAIQLRKTAARIRDNPDNMKTNFLQVAARFKEENKPVKVSDNNRSSEANNVDKDLKTYLGANPEAQTEFNTHLQTARAEGAAQGNISTDRKRIISILINAGVTISEEAAQAINSDMSSGDFAEQELQRQRAIRDTTVKNNPVDFGALIAKQTPGEQDITQGHSRLSNEDYDKESEKLAKMAIGGRA